MTHTYYHAKSSARVFGGQPEDYLAIHNWFDATTQRWTFEPAHWSTWLLRLVVWAAVLLTIYSGWGYVQNALRMLKR